MNREPAAWRQPRPESPAFGRMEDAGEITDKGYVNQRQVLAKRAALVELLYAQPVPAGVIVAERTA